MTATKHELQKAANPSYITAKGCLGLMAAAGNKQAARFYSAIDSSELSKMTSPSSPDLTRSFMVAQEARYKIWDIVAQEDKAKNIIDLPCGYMPHCLQAASLGKRYYGLDLPIVTDEIASVAQTALDEDGRKLVSYHGVDATNYDSMWKVLNNVSGELCIISDGFLGFFNLPELETVLKNIHRLLTEFGGLWYTADPHGTLLQVIPYNIIYGRDMAEGLQKTKQSSAKAANVDNGKYIFSECSPEERCDFLAQHGFHLQKSFSYAEKLDKLHTLEDEPDMMHRVIVALEDVYEYVITPSKMETSDSTKECYPFAAILNKKNDNLYISLQGRLDTINAPELMEKFEKQQAESSFSTISIDMLKVDFVSGAGIRILQLMRESLKSEEKFRLENTAPHVLKMLKEGGFFN